MTTDRDLGAELLAAVRELEAGGGRRHRVDVPRDVPAIRRRMGLSQAAFAALLGVSPRTLEDWEQGRRRPRGPALALLRVADRRPDALVG